jgi:hypothetical protein
MNVQRTQSAAHSCGHHTRRTLDSAIKTGKTAAAVGFAAVSGFIAGFLANPPELAKAKARR